MSSIPPPRLGIKNDKGVLNWFRRENGEISAKTGPSQKTSYERFRDRVAHRVMLWHRAGLDARIFEYKTGEEYAGYKPSEELKNG